MTMSMTEPHDFRVERGYMGQSVHIRSSGVANKMLCSISLQAGFLHAAELIYFRAKCRPMGPQGTN